MLQMVLGWQWARKHRLEFLASRQEPYGVTAEQYNGMIITGMRNKADEELRRASSKKSDEHRADMDRLTGEIEDLQRDVHFYKHLVNILRILLRNLKLADKGLRQSLHEAIIDSKETWKHYSLRKRVGALRSGIPPSACECGTSRCAGPM